ncbi:MAG: nucleotidyltransferase domain-containing protein [bacterium]
MVKTRSEIEDLVYHYTRNLQERGAEVDKIVLFGSHASGKASENSDIDIAVISPFFRTLGIRERQEFLGRAFVDIYEPIEVLGFTSEEFDKAQQGTMIYEIKNKKPAQEMAGLCYLIFNCS